MVDMGSVETTKRPKLIWFTLILSVVVLLLLIAGVVDIIISRVEIIDGPGYKILIFSLIEKIVQVVCVVFLIAGVLKRKQYGWYLTVLFSLIIAIYTVARLFFPEYMGANNGLLEIESRAEIAGAKLASVIMAVLGVAFFGMHFRERVRLYFQQDEGENFGPDR